MTENYLLLPILLPLAGAMLVLLLPRAMNALRVPIALLATAGGVVAAWLLFQQAALPDRAALEFVRPWAGFGITFALKLTRLNAFILLAAAAFGFLVTLFSWRFMEGSKGVAARPHAKQFFAYLQITLAMAAGAVLADDLVALLFFWEGLLCTMFGLVIIGRSDAWKTAIKALIIVGISDLCLMAGIGLTYALTGTLRMSEIGAHVGDITGLTALAMVLLLIGAMGKGGAMPFHSWIPDAAVDAPMPFMALIPAAMEKLLGIYLMARITLDMFPLTPNSSISTLLMIVGAVTILLAVAMALVQKDFKRLLSYHAISQVGYMILGIGTATAFGVIGGLFHMINNALYKSLLFCTGGAVEHRTGTTDLAKLGGLGAKMPITCLCFVIAALSISGFPLTNGFFSKELVYEGARQRNVIFYAAALLGSFLTAASFLKLGHAAFFGKRNPEHDTVREAPAAMLLPMILLAAGCLIFAYNPFSVGKVILPTVEHAAVIAEHNFAEEPMTGLPTDMMLVLGTVVVLAAAIVNHIVGVKRTGSGLGAVDHIHYAPVLHTTYNLADRRAFDPYEWLLKLVAVVSGIGFAIDRIIDWIQDGLATGLARALSALVRAANTGSYAAHILWAVIGAAAVVYFLAFGRG